MNLRSKFLSIFMGSLFWISVSTAYKPEDLEEFYRQYNSGEEIVCQRFNLRDADLSGLKLLKANFSGADLTKTDFRGTDLSGADVTGANLNGAKLKKAVLKNLIAFDTSAKGTCLEDQSFLKANNIQFSVSAFKTQKLDLHGCVLKSVPGLIDAFLKSSYGRWSKIEIVTGRGIHNLSETKGKLSRFCEKYLQENYSLYFKEMMSINSGGSWLLILNKQKKQKVRSEDDDS